MAVVQTYDRTEFLNQPYDPLFLSTVTGPGSWPSPDGYIGIRNYSGNAFGFPRHAVLESGQIFATQAAPFQTLKWWWADWVYANGLNYNHIGAQVRFVERPEDTGGWYPTAGNTIEDGTGLVTNEWLTTAPTRCRVTTSSSVYLTNGSSIRIDFWGESAIADCKAGGGSPSGYQFMIIPLRSTQDNLAVQLMIDLHNVTDEERLELAKYLSYDIVLPEKDKWYTIVWDLQQFKSYYIQNVGVALPSVSKPAALYIDRIEVGNYWSDQTKTVEFQPLGSVAGWYGWYQQGDFSSIKPTGVDAWKQTYFQFRMLLGTPNRLNDAYATPYVNQVTLENPLIASVQEVAVDVLRYSKTFEKRALGAFTGVTVFGAPSSQRGVLQFPMRSGSALELVPGS